MKNVFIFLLLLPAHFIFCQEVNTFEDLLRPHQIAVDRHQLYIADGSTISIYSLTDLALKNRFGKQGEGPQEFKIGGNSRIKMVVTPEYIFVNSEGRVSFFSKDGRFRKEINAPFGRDFQPFGSDFIGFHYVPKEKKPSDKMKAIKIFDSNLNEIKEIFRMKGRYERGKGYRIFPEPHVFRVYENKIFLGGKIDFVIRVFNREGEILFSIEKEYKKQKVEERHKRDVLNYARISPRYRDRYDFFRKLAVFPEYFPAIRDFFVADGTVYVMTYEKVEENTAFFIFDIDGNLIKKIFIPIIEDNLYAVTNPFTIGNGKCYQLVENKDGVWELHTHEIR